MAAWLLNLTAAPAPAKTGTGQLSTTAKATAQAGAKNRTATGSVTASGTLRAVAGAKARTGRGALTTSAKLTGRTGIKVRTGHGALTTSAEQTGRAGIKSRSGQGASAAIAVAAAHAGMRGASGAGRISGVGVLYLRIGSRASSAGGTLAALAQVHALSGAEGDFGTAYLIVSGTLAAQAGIGHVIPVERSGQVALTASAQVHAAAGISDVHLITGTARLIVHPSLQGVGYASRIGTATGIAARGVLAAQGLTATTPETIHEVVHLALVVAGGQGYLPRGTYLAPGDEGKYIVGSSEDDNAILLRSGLNAAGADILIAGGIRSESDGPPSIYACVSRTH